MIVEQKCHHVACKHSVHGAYFRCRPEILPPELPKMGATRVEMEG